MDCHFASASFPPRWSASVYDAIAFSNFPSLNCLFPRAFASSPAGAAAGAAAAGAAAAAAFFGAAVAAPRRSGRSISALTIIGNAFMIDVLHARAASSSIASCPAPAMNESAYGPLLSHVIGIVTCGNPVIEHTHVSVSVFRRHASFSSGGASSFGAGPGVVGITKIVSPSNSAPRDARTSSRASFMSAKLSGATFDAASMRFLVP
eukprot:30850-Pelagococcus_subviridis.AAC.33